MPVSDHSNISPIMRKVALLQPKTVLDIGIGFGKYGVLCRELLDIEPGRLDPKTWETTIVGIEGFAQYANPLHESMYSQVFYEDFRNPDAWGEYYGYDLVLMVDSLEHVEEAVGRSILRYLIMSNKHVIVSCPFGVNYLEQGAVNGNELERHQTHWQPSDFEKMGGTILYTGVCSVAYFRGTKD